ncbi:hypothetical protein AAVH_10818 [Aphelenchoides avenae]|nr:hypothetical protein AAVH_10818 [Aphelenchus avenae]
MPDLLIGQDMVHLFDRRLEPSLPIGFYVVHTFMGPTIGGASRSITSLTKAFPSSIRPGALPATEDADLAENSSRRLLAPTL